MPQVGDKVWIFQPDYRLTRENEKYQISHRASRGQFLERTIIGESDNSWFVGTSFDPIENAKPFEKSRPRGLFFELTEANDGMVTRERAVKAASELLRNCDSELLAAVTELVTDPSVNVPLYIEGKRIATALQTIRNAGYIATLAQFPERVELDLTYDMGDGNFHPAFSMAFDNELEALETAVKWITEEDEDHDL